MPGDLWGEKTVEHDNGQEREEIDRMVQKRLSPWRDYVRASIEKAVGESTWDDLPAAVLAIYRHLGQHRDLAVRMAAIFQMIYLASTIHESVRDEEEGQIYGRDMQFSILIGDYISGCVLKMLVESNADHLLDIFADTIAQINEGMVMKHKLGSDLEQVIGKTRASLYEAAFRCAARTSGVKAGDQFWYAELGFYTGMVLETQSLAGLHPDLINGYSDKGRHIFSLVDHKGPPCSNILELLLRRGTERDLARAVI